MHDVGGQIVMYSTSCCLLKYNNDSKSIKFLKAKSSDNKDTSIIFSDRNLVKNITLPKLSPLGQYHYQVQLM